MWPMPHWKTHNPNGRPKYNVEQKKRIGGNLQTLKKAPPRIVISQKKTLKPLPSSRGNPKFFLKMV